MSKPNTDHYPVICCTKLKNTLDEDALMCVMPRSETPDKPHVWIQSDGGHGGMEAIEYCPFCGTKIKFDLETIIRVEAEYDQRRREMERTRRTPNRTHIY